MHKYCTTSFYVWGNKSTAIKKKMQCPWISHSRIRTFLDLSRTAEQQILALRLPTAGRGWLWHTANQCIPFSKDQKVPVGVWTFRRSPSGCCRGISPWQSCKGAEALGWAEEVQRGLHLTAKEENMTLLPLGSHVIHLHDEPLVHSNHALL